MSPGPIRDAYRAWLASLPGIGTGQSEVSIPGSMGVFLERVAARPGVDLMPPQWDSEFVHLHPDGSVHVILPPDDVAEILEKHWGEPHPYYGQHRGSHSVDAVLVYAPRTADELKIVEQIVGAAYEYATGRSADTQ
ncbi:DUF5519 family protein [Nocardia yamanashiensis]|uniref:luciferase domain-containing protein n=1 Tax=Nocardia yamanashiensis TaxID=209247 RepID=UPI001E64EDE9|nr:luciferase family protein [Nocardia yamanashiensis]UGT38827.1 DUF5519 family protein [Nocardia yamanashiensis]